MIESTPGRKDMVEVPGSDSGYQSSADKKIRWRRYIDIILAQQNGWIVFFLLAFVYAYFYHEPEFNGNSRLALTAAIVEEGRLTIDSFHDNSGFATGDKSIYQGHYYTDKAIGSSLLAALPYAPIYWGARFIGYRVGPWLAAHILTFLVIGLPSAFAGALIYIVCQCISGSPLRAGIVTAAVTLGSISFPFSLVFIGHQLAAALLWISFFLILRMKSQDHPPAHWYALLCGFLPGLSLITEYTTALIVLPLIGYYLYVIWLKREKFQVQAILFPLLGGLLPICLMLAYNILVFGQPLVNGYQYQAEPSYREAMAQGVMGIGLPNMKVLFFETFQPAMGLFWQSPALLMIFPGAYYILRNRRYRVEGALAIFSFTVYLVINSGYFEWWGGYSSSPRHIIPMLPFLCLPLIFVPRRFTPLLAVLTVISVAQMILIAASKVIVPNPAMNNFSELRFFEYSTIYHYCLPALLKGNFSWNLGRNLFGLSDWISLAPVMLAIAGLFVYVRWIPPKEQKMIDAVFVQR